MNSKISVVKRERYCSAGNDTDESLRWVVLYRTDEMPFRLRIFRTFHWQMFSPIQRIYKSVLGSLVFAD